MRIRDISQSAHDAGCAQLRPHFDSGLVISNVRSQWTMQLKFRRLGARSTLVLVGSVTLTACGGGESSAPTPAQSVALQVQMPQQPAAELDALTAVPLFHTAPVLLDEPDDTDSLEHNASAAFGPHTQYV